jgi:hypothetical protein
MKNDSERSFAARGETGGLSETTKDAKVTKKKQKGTADDADTRGWAALMQLPT